MYGRQTVGWTVHMSRVYLKPELMDSLTPI